MLIHDCIPCQHGDHAGHHRIVQTVPEGMMGGQECHCEGECVERAARRPQEPILPLPNDYTKVVEQMDELFGKPSS
jgi:hypothetical protein